MGPDVPVAGATLKGSTMTEKTASVHWEGPGKKGQGQISTETGALQRHPNGFASRFEDDRLSPKGEGFEIDRILLRLSAAVPGIDEARFQEIALAARRACPLSKALAGVAEISLQATLESAAS
jgi:osmotically inducible protein OsmC